MVVIRLGARAPLRPLARVSVPSPAFRKLEIGKNCARKNIFGVTKNEREKNLKLATTLLKSSVVSFVNKWNFNPITETPLSSGKYSWVPFQSKIASKPENKELIEMNLDFKSSAMSKTTERIDSKPSVGEIDTFPSEDSANEEGKSILLPSCTENLSPLINSLNLNNVSLSPLCGAPKSVGPSSSSASSFEGKSSSSSSFKSPKEKKYKQTKITDYGRIVKRKSRNVKFSINQPL